MGMLLRLALLTASDGRGPAGVNSCKQRPCGKGCRGERSGLPVEFGFLFTCIRIQKHISLSPNFYRPSPCLPLLIIPALTLSHPLSPNHPLKPLSVSVVRVRVTGCAFPRWVALGHHGATVGSNSGGTIGCGCTSSSAAVVSVSM